MIAPGLKLTDLSPKWWHFDEGGPRVGLTFICPCCVGTERETHLGIAFHHKGHEAIDDQYIRAHGHGKEEHIWELNGVEDFHNLTLNAVCRCQQGWTLARLYYEWRNTMNGIGKKRFRVALDFDNTVVMDSLYDKTIVGNPVPFALYWIEKWQEAGAEIYLWTMRGREGSDGDRLTPAIKYLWENGIKLDGVNRGEQPWTDSPKPSPRSMLTTQRRACH